MNLTQDGFSQDTLFQRIETEKWDQARLTEILGRFKNQKVLILGDLGVDRYTLGAVDRISPEAPVPIVYVQQELLKLGLAANVADNIQELGGQASLIGVVGEDRSKEDFELLLKQKNLSTEGLVYDSSRRTVLKERIVSENQQLLRVDYENLEPLNETIENQLIEKIDSQISQSDALVIEDYAKGLLNEKVCQNAISIAEQKKKKILVDPNSKSPLSFYHHSGLLTPNRREAESLTNEKITDLKSLYHVGQKLMKETQAKQLLITLGKDGIAIFESGETKATWIPTFAKDVYDVSGAGDTVISTVTLALLSDANIYEAAILGNLAGGIVVGKRGTATTSVDEIKKSMNRF